MSEVLKALGQLDVLLMEVMGRWVQKRPFQVEIISMREAALKSWDRTRGSRRLLRHGLRMMRTLDYLCMLRARPHACVRG